MKTTRLHDWRRIWRGVFAGELRWCARCGAVESIEDESRFLAPGGAVPAGSDLSNHAAWVRTEPRCTRNRGGSHG